MDEVAEDGGGCGDDAGCSRGHSAAGSGGSESGGDPGGGTRQADQETRVDRSLHRVPRRIAGWRWIFLINVPVGITALIVVTKVLNLPHTPQRARIDWPGALTLTTGLVPLLLIAEQGREWGWVSTAAIICYTAGAIGLTAFLACEYKLGDDALLPLRLFRSRVFSPDQPRRRHHRHGHVRRHLFEAPLRGCY